MLTAQEKRKIAACCAWERKIPLHSFLMPTFALKYYKKKIIIILRGLNCAKNILAR